MYRGVPLTSVPVPHRIITDCPGASHDVPRNPCGPGFVPTRTK